MNSKSSRIKHTFLSLSFFNLGTIMIQYHSQWLNCSNLPAAVYILLCMDYHDYWQLFLHLRSMLNTTNIKLAIITPLRTIIIIIHSTILPTNSCVELKNADPNDCPRHRLIPEQHLSHLIFCKFHLQYAVRKGWGLNDFPAHAHSYGFGCVSVNVARSETAPLPIVETLMEK